MQLSIQSPSASPIKFKGGRVQLGLCGLANFHGFSPLLNWWKAATITKVFRTDGSAVVGQAAIDAGYLTSDGEVVDPVPADMDRFERQFFVRSGNIGENYNNEQFALTFTGAAKNVALNLAGSNAVQPGKTSPTTFGLGGTPGQGWLVFFVTPGQSNPPRDINVYQTRYASAVAAGKKLNPDWVNAIKEFSPLRCMDLMGTNNSPVIAFEDFATEQFYLWNNGINTNTGFSPAGTKYSIPLTIPKEIALETGREIWVNIPHRASDDCVLKLARFCKNNIPQKVHFEYTNEPWNQGFGAPPNVTDSNLKLNYQHTYCLSNGQATFWPGDGNANMKWAGYRAAQCMKIIRDEYNDRSRWAGKLAVQNANPSTFDYYMVGVDRYLSVDLANALTVTDLFDDVAGTGYWGAGPMSSYFITAITREANALVTTNGSHNFTVDQEVIFGFENLTGSMRELELLYGTVTAKPTANQIRVNIDTTNFAAYTGFGVVVHGNMFRLMKQSEDLNQSNPSAYPTKYTYFSQQLSEAFLTGSISSGLASTGDSPLQQAAGVWLQLKQKATPRGLGFCQYEGGCHWLGGQALKANGPSTNRLCARYEDFLKGSSHTPEFAKVYSEMYRQFHAIGGHHPAKFVEAGLVGIHGGWGGMRYMPFGTNATAEVNNPVWKATRAGNMAHFAP